MSQAHSSYITRPKDVRCCLFREHFIKTSALYLRVTVGIYFTLLFRHDILNPFWLRLRIVSSFVPKKSALNSWLNVT